MSERLLLWVTTGLEQKPEPVVPSGAEVAASS